MFGNITLSKTTINCNVNYVCLKDTIIQFIGNNDNELKNIKMECQRIINGNLLEFNLSVSSLVVSLGAFFVSLLGEDVGSYKPGMELGFYFGIIAILFFSIKLHYKKQNAGKILYVIEEIEKEKHNCIE